MLGVERKQLLLDFTAWLARNRMVLLEYQYWLKSPFSLFFNRKSFAFFYMPFIQIIYGRGEYLGDLIWFAIEGRGICHYETIFRRFV